MSHFAMGVRLASAVRQCSPAAARWAGGVAARLPLAGRPAQLLVVRASSSMDNNISSGLMESMRGKIQAALDAQMVTVEDMQGDGACGAQRRARAGVCGSLAQWVQQQRAADGITGAAALLAAAHCSRHRRQATMWVVVWRAHTTGPACRPC